MIFKNALFGFLTAILLVSTQASPLDFLEKRAETSSATKQASSTAKKTSASATSTTSAASSSSSSSSNVTAAGANPIKKGYTAFGDSFAAGIGTGTTEGSGCRQGQYSYPKQLASTVSNSIDFQNLPCSGAKIDNVLSGGKNSQEDAWKNPGDADIATISIGGNDIGFYNILTACVLWVGGPFAGNCDDELQKANNMLTGNDLYSSIQSTLKQLVDKSGKDSFKIYMTGYPQFFRADTDWCDDTSFRIYNPHHTSNPLANGEPWLTKDLRTKLNTMVTNLNTFLSGIVDAVNKYYQNNERVVFIDPNPYFDGHRWCDQDNGQDVKEPDANRMDTWFFLSSWGDNSLPADPNGASDSYNQQEATQLAGNTTALPDPNTCKQTLASTNNTDWASMMQCDIAKAITNTSSFEYQVMSQEFQQDKNKNLTTLEVPWYVPTRLAKTFHPRTLGQQALKNAIMAKW